MRGCFLSRTILTSSACLCEGEKKTFWVFARLLMASAQQSHLHLSGCAMHKTRPKICVHDRKNRRKEMCATVVLNRGSQCVAGGDDEMETS